jgi:hypothetical protein
VSDDKPVGIWVGASHALGRPVAVAGEEYPHICGISVTGCMTGVRYRLTRRDCAACGEKNAPKTQEQQREGDPS